MVIKTLRRICAVLLTLAGIATFAALVVPQLFGWQAYVVTSGSMSPTFDAGAIVVTAPVDGNTVRTGDIVTFREPSGLTTHRIAGMTSTSDAGVVSMTYTTQGDANEEPDAAPLHPENIVGKAQFIVPKLGYLVSFVKSPLGAGAFAALFLFVVFTGGKRSEDACPEPASDLEPVPVS